LRRRNQSDRIADEQVEFAVAVHVRDPDARRGRGAGKLVFVERLAVFRVAARLDQRSERPQLRRLASPGDIFGPLHAAVRRPAEQIEITVAIPVGDEWIAVMAFDSQGTLPRLHRFGFGFELAFPLSTEQVKRSVEVADDQIEVAVAVPVDGEWPGADGPGP